MINMSEYDVIYKEIVYHCVDMQPDIEESCSEDQSVIRPKFIFVTCIDQDGEVISFHDETFMFRFIRKAGAK